MSLWSKLCRKTEDGTESGFVDRCNGDVEKGLKGKLVHSQHQIQVCLQFWPLVRTIRVLECFSMSATRQKIQTRLISIQC